MHGGRHGGPGLHALGGRDPPLGRRRQDPRGAQPDRGAQNIARFFAGILAKAPPGFVVRRSTINGRPGLIGYFADGRPHSVTTLDVAQGNIRAIHLVVNPEKLRAVQPLKDALREEAPE